MNRHRQIFTLCIFVILTCQIAQGMFLNYLQPSEANYRDYPLPPGYHLETLNDIQQNYNSNTYSIVSGDQALSMYTYGAAGVRGADNRKNRVKRSYISSFFNDETPQPASDPSVPSPPAAQDVNQKTDGVKTVAETTGTTGGDTAASEIEPVAATQVSGVGQTVTGKPSSTTDSATSTDTGTTTVDFSKVVDDFQSFSKAAVEEINQDMDKTLVEIGPYLPLVYKVAVFVVPGLMPFDTIMFTWQVAKITMSEIEKYDNGETLTSVTADGVSKVAYKYFMNKRSFSFTDEATVTPGPTTSNTITDFATNFYKKLKDMLSFRKESDSLVSTQISSDSSSVTNKIINTNDKILSVSNTKFYPTTNKLDNIRELKMNMNDDDSVQDLSDSEGNGVLNANIAKLKSLKLKKSSEELEKYKNPTSDADSSESLSDAEGNLVQDVKNISKLKSKLSRELGEIPKIDIDGSINPIESPLNNSVEKVKKDEGAWYKMFSMDSTRFDELLKRSMAYQHDFIKNSDGEKLAKCLTTMKSQIPQSTEAEIKKSFANLASKMHFDENVTENQISDLVNLLSKSTCYFIANGIHDKKAAGAS